MQLPMQNLYVTQQAMLSGCARCAPMPHLRVALLRLPASAKVVAKMRGRHALPPDYGRLRVGAYMLATALAVGSVVFLPDITMKGDIVHPPSTTLYQPPSLPPLVPETATEAPVTATTQPGATSRVRISTQQQAPRASATLSAPPQRVAGASAAKAHSAPEASAAQTWGAPLPESDEFNYTGPPDSNKWGSIDGCGKGNAGNGQRCAANSTVGNGYLRQSGNNSGNTGWLSSRRNQKYGRWEARARMAPDGAGPHPYHPVLLLWPESEQWPQGGEEDFAETDIGSPGIDVFLHHPGNSGSDQDHYSAKVDITTWNTYAIDWQPGSIKVYVNGTLIANDTNPAAQPPGPMHGTIQLDDSTGGALQPAHMDVDWYRIYA